MGFERVVHKWGLNALPTGDPVLGVAANGNDELKACGELARACEGLGSAWESLGALGRAWEGLAAWDGLGWLRSAWEAW